eukprot:CAMPEP_0179130102 /NCGR_PEP_ID=MMETSP0796-20121207/61753_1 /TAXON_ID=73915 /ORGANISM="Pyrodinium bahamense, Strain pbaha01" /LENGTH=434 /DNA_ID=CAMNT_0020828995 /DNA_START=71 /DNA_END=1375 /DNA_ORIENTATION=+
MARAVVALSGLVTHMGPLTIASAERAENVPTHRRIRQPKPAVLPSDVQQSAIKSAADSMDVVAAVVPPATNTGPDGYPQLPAVSAILGSASETLKTINSQASVLEARVVQAQMENEAKMARQKAVFEDKLKTQEERNREMVEANNQISAEVAELKANNSGLRKHAKELQEGNRLMRTELRTLQSRLNVAQDFIASSLQSTDDSKAPELAVFQPPKAAHHKAHHRHVYLEYGSHSAEKGSDDDQDEDDDDADESDSDDDDDNDDPGASFLSLAERVRRSATARAAAGSEVEPPVGDTEAAASATPPSEANPRDLLVVLSRGVTDLQKEERESEAKLKAMFLASFQAGTRRHAALTTQQRALNATRTSLQLLQSKLVAADEHLEKTQASLEQRLRGFGLFAQRLAHLALAPVGEVPRLLKALPEAVSTATAPTHTD